MDSYSKAYILYRMPPSASKMSKPTPLAPIFQPRTPRNVPRQDYTTIQRRPFEARNPPAASTIAADAASCSATATPISTPSTQDDAQDRDTIEVIPPGHPDYDSDEEMVDIDNEAAQPPLPDLTYAEKLEATLKWKKHKKSHHTKMRAKASHVYWYMTKEEVLGVFYADPEDPKGPKCLQQIRWTCRECLKEPNKLSKTFEVLESHRNGVTTGMGKHLKRVHRISKETHFARIYGYSTGGIMGGSYTEVDPWSGRPQPRARITKPQSIRRWFVKTRQPLSAVESTEFQEMFLAHGTQCAYKSRTTLRNHIYDDFTVRRQRLRLELHNNCVSISFTLDIWTAPNRVPIFAVIAHWYTESFEEREEVIEFLELHESHTGESLAKHVQALLKELDIEQKLFAITGDNAGNNGTLSESLFNSLRKKYDDRVTPLGRPLMRFHGRPSWIRCLAHINALLCDSVLKDLHSSSAKEAKKKLDDWDKAHKNRDYTIPDDAGRNSVAKVRLLNLWMLRSSHREQDWRSYPKLSNRRPIYDVDTRWNSCLDMIEQFLELEAEYEAFIDSHPQVACLKLTNLEVVALNQLACVLRPFKEHTLQVSRSMPSIAKSLEIYWDLEELINSVINGEGKFSEINQPLRDAFKKGKEKYIKYRSKLERNAVIYAAHTLDPRCKSSMIQDMMPTEATTVITSVKKYFKKEWPELAKQSTLVSTTSSSPENRPAGISGAQWKAIQNRKAREAESHAALATSELDRWLQSPPIEFDESTNQDRDFLRKWWKENAHSWPALAKAARALLPCSASEVDVERLFSGCRDEYGLRRHALKADTVRVMTLLRSQYTSEDSVDRALIDDAMQLDVGEEMRFSVLWRPDRIDSIIQGIHSLFYVLLKSH